MAKTVPLTEADPLVALNVALAVVPGDAQGVPETPLQLVAEVSLVAPLAPVQVPLVCAEAVAASASSAAMASDRAAGSQMAPTPEATNWGFDFMVVGNFYLISGGKYFVPPQDSTHAQGGKDLTRDQMGVGSRGFHGGVSSIDSRFRKLYKICKIFYYMQYMCFR